MNKVMVDVFYPDKTEIMLFSVTVHIKDIKKHIYNFTELSIIEEF